MYRKLLTCAMSTLAGLIIAGCSTDVNDGGIVEKPGAPDPNRAKEDQKKFMEGMKGMYKGAPGVPTKK
jgi:hypothetical protein